MNFLRKTNIKSYKMPKPTWLYDLRKTELMKVAEEFNLDAHGTVDDIRKRLLALVSSDDLTEEQVTRLQELEKQYKRVKSPLPLSTSTFNETETQSLTNVASQTLAFSEVVLPQNNCMNSVIQTSYTPPLSPPSLTYVQMIDQIRKWPVKYDGGKEPLAFLERVEELAEVYQVDINVLPRAMPELLRDRALAWYRNNNQQWTLWSVFKQDFIRFFLSSRYRQRMEDEIRQRRQKPQENFKDYVLSLQTLMRHAGYTEEQKLDRILDNASQAVQLYIRRKDFSNLIELLDMAEDHERIQGFEEHGRNVNKRNFQPMHCTVDTLTEAPINIATACRRCGQDGHFRSGCRNPKVLFCWNCGRRHVLTIKCCGLVSGNGKEDRPQRGTSEPQIHMPQNQ